MIWTYKGEPVETISDEYIGFVYLITNTTNGKKYIGKKLAKFKVTRPPLKGKTRKRHGYKESDWQEYWGSSDKLKEDIAHIGKDKFTREILFFCTSKAELGYIEAKLQFEHKVLETDEYYNGIIDVRVGGSKALLESLQRHNTGTS